MIQRRGAELNPEPSRGDSEGGYNEEFRWAGKWYVGSEKRTLLQYIDGERGPPLPEHKRPRIHLTPLWDDKNLYFFAEMEDEDLYADLSEHDERIWENDVFELFFKPHDHRFAYYEFQVNAKNAVLDMFLASRGSGGYRRWARDRMFHLKNTYETFVHV